MQFLFFSKHVNNISFLVSAEHRTDGSNDIAFCRLHSGSASFVQLFQIAYADFESW